MTGVQDPDDWWYARVYPGRLDLMDDASRLCLRWLRDQARRVHADRWFFIRYVDMTGPHLRLRLRCPADGVDELHGRRDELRELLEELPAAGSGDRLVPRAPLGMERGPRKVQAGLYSPELRKYGGAAGVAVAEQFFTRCSRWYLDHDVPDLDPLTDRLTLAVLFMDRVVRAGLPTGVDAFWETHRKHWGWHLRMAAPARDEVRDVVHLVRRGSGSGSGSTTPALRALDAHVAELVDALSAAADRDVAVPRHLLLLNHLHMEMNRWGYLPAEECAIGLVAAAGGHPT